LAMVLQKTCAARLLDSYSVERSAVGAEVLKAAGRLTSVAVMRNPAAQSVRNLIGRIMLGLAPVRNAMVEQMTEISIGYAQSPLNGASVHGLNGPEPGQRILPVSGQSPAGTGSKPLFTLFAEPSEETARLLRDHPTLIDRTLRTPPDTRGMWLGRPDGYTACVSREGNAGPIAAYLAALT
jgi:hypothetical protein